MDLPINYESPHKHMPVCVILVCTETWKSTTQTTDSAK